MDVGQINAACPDPQATAQEPNPFEKLWRPVKTKELSTSPSTRLNRFLKEKTQEMNKQNVRLQTIGRTNMLPEKTRSRLKAAIEKTAHNTELTLTLAISYGSREEIADAAKTLAHKAVKGEIDPDSIDTKTFASHLYAPDQPDPDLLIRTSGELRLSNFLLWQLSYAEIVVLDKLWPDFGEADLQQAIEQYNSRHRRFGTV